MSDNLCKRGFVFLVAFALSPETILNSSVAETSRDTHGDGLAHKCADGIVCTQTLACAALAASWQVAEWEPEWFSTAVKRLTNRNFGPEPTPPIS